MVNTGCLLARAHVHTHTYTHTSLVTGRRAIKGLRLEGSGAALRKQQTRKVQGNRRTRSWELSHVPRGVQNMAAVFTVCPTGTA